VMTSVRMVAQRWFPHLLRSILLLLRPVRGAVRALLLGRAVPAGLLPGESMLLLRLEPLLAPILLLLRLSAVAPAHGLLLTAVATHWLPHRALLSTIRTGLLAITTTRLLTEALLATRSRVGALLSTRARLRAVGAGLARRLSSVSALLMLLGRELSLLRRRDRGVLRRGLRLGIAAGLRSSCEITCGALCGVSHRCQPQNSVVDLREREPG